MAVENRSTNSILHHQAFGRCLTVCVLTCMHTCSMWGEREKERTYINHVHRDYFNQQIDTYTYSYIQTYAQTVSKERIFNLLSSMNVNFVYTSHSACLSGIKKEEEAERE